MLLVYSRLVMIKPEIMYFPTLCTNCGPTWNLPRSGRQWFARLLTGGATQCWLQFGKTWCTRLKKVSMYQSWQQDLIGFDSETQAWQQIGNLLHVAVNLPNEVKLVGFATTFSVARKFPLCGNSALIVGLGWLTMLVKLFDQWITIETINHLYWLFWASLIIQASPRPQSLAVCNLRTISKAFSGIAK